MALKVIPKTSPKHNDHDLPHVSTAPPQDALPSGTAEIIHFPEPASDICALTEDDLAYHFVTEHHQKIRHDHDVGAWYVYDSTRWKQDTRRGVFHELRMHCRKQRKGSPRMGSCSSVIGAELFASRDKRVAVNSSAWDPDPWLRTPEGTINLKNGASAPAKPDDMMSRVTRVGPAPKGTSCPNFEKFLGEVTGGDLEYRRLLQRYAGYCLTGLTTEQKVLFIYGPGGNGKSVFLNVLADIMGEYATSAAMETFMSTAQGRHLCELARLRDVRFVRVSEVERGQKWYEARIKLLTGGEPITANFMRRDPFAYDPKFKLVFSGNHRPEMKGVDDAARRRFLFAPFIYQPKEVDHGLPDKLRSEYPAILRWAIQGCTDWAQNGLAVPSVVQNATDEYFQAEDLMGQWIEECCVQGEEVKTASAILYKSFNEFVVERNEDAVSFKRFGIEMRSRGFKPSKSSHAQYVGIRLKT